MDREHEKIFSGRNDLFETRKVNTADCERMWEMRITKGTISDCPCLESVLSDEMQETHRADGRGTGACEIGEGSEFGGWFGKIIEMAV